MKKSILILALSLTISSNINAQLLFHETFDYTPGEPLVANPKASSDNITNTRTGWLTLVQGNSNVNCFDISPNNLLYEGYSQPGDNSRSLQVLDNQGQDVFKAFVDKNGGESYLGPKTIYASFLINIPSGTTTPSNPDNVDDGGANGDFLFALKANPSGSDYNYYGRIFIKAMGSTSRFALGKYSNKSSAWSMPFNNGQTHLIVMKYELGGLNGETRDQEVANGYDDKITVYINPTDFSNEPARATLTYENSTEGDAYRFSGSNQVIGGLAGVYFRTPDSKKGYIPECLIDDIRVSETYAGLFDFSTGIQNTKNEDITIGYNKDSQTINIVSGDTIAYNIYSINGIKIKGGCLASGQNFIKMENTNKGIYLIEIKSEDSRTVKKIIID